MLVEVTIPQFSESVSEGTLVAIHKKVGQSVVRDENIADVETDKVVLEVPAPASGVITEIKKAEGDVVVSQELIAVIDTEAVATTTAPVAEKTAPVASATPAVAPVVSNSPASTAPIAKGTSPAAAKLIQESGANVAQGTGRDGRVTKADVLAVLSGATTATTHRIEERVPMSRLRAKIAERLLESQQTNAILTTFNEVNMKAVIDLRNQYKDKFEKEHGVKLGFMSFFVKAAVHALKKYPILNASVDGNEIIYHGYFDIGIAVGSPRGLVVPILRDADRLSIAEIEKAIANFGQKAKDGKLTMEDLSGGTFSISNGGVFGSMLSTPIINPPQSAILGVHATKDRAVVENGQVVIRPINYLAMSYDHRIIDGREAVLGLVAMKEALEDPARLLFDL
jgi:2-oxoglutarate dehydrogenase E2 component (dihydrolipoamide succinyltransferase)